MKLIVLSLSLFIGTLCEAAQWDGTQGVYTVRTHSFFGSEPQTVVTVQSADPGHDIIVVTAYLKLQPGEGVLDRKSMTKVIGAKPPRPEAATFPMPENQIDSIRVCGYTEGNGHLFTRPFSR